MLSYAQFDGLLNRFLEIIASIFVIYLCAAVVVFISNQTEKKGKEKRKVVRSTYK